MTSPLPPDLPRPRSLLEFTRLFATDEACAEYLFKVRWPNGFVCPKCGSTKGWPRRQRPLIECANGHQISVTTDTAMHRSKQSLMTWFYAAYLVSTLTPGISALQFQRRLKNQVDLLFFSTRPINQPAWDYVSCNIAVD